ncbi:MAG: hypothetical protein IID55_06620 [Proteobacteria bacterium]|nr:hypothetical protein [Pseudomonadota bacterium]
MLRRFLGRVVLTLTVLGLGVASAAAQAPRLLLELNKVESSSEGCQFHIVIRNNTGSDIEVLGADLVFFDQNGVMANRSNVSFGKVKSNKTLFRTFVFPGLNCGDVGQVLVNELTQCQLARETQIDCLDIMDVSSRAEIDFFK